MSTRSGRIIIIIRNDAKSISRQNFVLGDLIIRNDAKSISRQNFVLGDLIIIIIRNGAKTISLPKLCFWAT